MSTIRDVNTSDLAFKVSEFYCYVAHMPRIDFD